MWALLKLNMNYRSYFSYIRGWWVLYVIYLNQNHIYKISKNKANLIYFLVQSCLKKKKNQQKKTCWSKSYGTCTYIISKLVNINQLQQQEGSLRKQLSAPSVFNVRRNEHTTDRFFGEKKVYSVLNMLKKIIFIPITKSCSRRNWRKNIWRFGINCRWLGWNWRIWIRFCLKNSLIL